MTDREFWLKFFPSLKNYFPKFLSTILAHPLDGGYITIEQFEKQKATDPYDQYGHPAG